MEEISSVLLTFMQAPTEEMDKVKTVTTAVPGGRRRTRVYPMLPARGSEGAGVGEG